MRNHTVLKTLSLFIFIVLFCSLFFPYHHSWVGNMEYSRHQLGVIRIYADSEIGYVKIINGFGSNFGISNIVIQVFLLCGMHFLPKEPVFPITASGFLIVSLILLAYGNIGGSGGPIGDKMLSGFYLALPFSLANIIIAYAIVYKAPAPTSTLLDEAE